MSFQATLRTDAFSNALGISSVRNFTGDLQVSIGQSVAGLTTDQEILAGIDISELKLLVISSDVALTIKTNNSGAPTDTLSIAAGVPYIWGENDYNAKLLTGDVTKLFVTNATAGVAALRILALINLP